MAKAIFHQAFGWSRPASSLGFHADPKPEPQSFPRDFIDAAIAAGRATEVPQKRSTPKGKSAGSAGKTTG